MQHVLKMIAKELKVSEIVAKQLLDAGEIPTQDNGNVLWADIQEYKARLQPKRAE